MSPVCRSWWFPKPFAKLVCILGATAVAVAPSMYHMTTDLVSLRPFGVRLTTMKAPCFCRLSP